MYLMLAWCFKSIDPITALMSEWIWFIPIWWKWYLNLKTGLFEVCIKLDKCVTAFPFKKQHGLFIIKWERALTGVGHLADSNSQQECPDVRKLVEVCTEVIPCWKIPPSLAWAWGLCHTWRFVCHRDQNASLGTGNPTFLWETKARMLWSVLWRQCFSQCPPFSSRSLRGLCQGLYSKEAVIIDVI